MTGAARSAEAVALSRAIETDLPAASRIFADPFARHFLGPVSAALARIACLPVFGDIVLRAGDMLVPGARGNVVGRTRFIDDALIAALREGVDQVVILGAGYDCRPYRLAALSKTPVFEVDQPHTQARKRAVIERILRTPPEVTFVSVDFDREPLGRCLAASGFVGGRRDFIVLEGVTEYLEPESVDETLRFVARTSARGSWLAFTYTHAGLIRGTHRFRGGRLLLEVNRVSAEPYRFGIDPAALEAYLAERGFSLVDEVGGAGYRQRYFDPRGRREAVNEYERVALARVVGGAGRR